MKLKKPRAARTSPNQTAAPMAGPDEYSYEGYKDTLGALGGHRVMPLGLRQRQV